jgi:antitoxin VapB
MSLNIKNERVHQLAKEAARVTGKSQTGAIEEALERLLRDYGADPARAEAARKVDVVRRLVAEYQSDPGRFDRGIKTVEDLYDESTGLPR